MPFEIGDSIKGTMPILALKPSEFSPAIALASIEVATEHVPLEGVVTKVTNDGEVEKFKLRKQIGQLEIGTSIKVEPQLGTWDIRPL